MVDFETFIFEVNDDFGVPHWSSFYLQSEHLKTHRAEFFHHHSGYLLWHEFVA